MIKIRELRPSRQASTLTCPACRVCGEGHQKSGLGRYAGLCEGCAKVRKTETWTTRHDRLLDEMVRTGYLPTGGIATQDRAAAYLGYCRKTVVSKLNGRRFPLSGELMAEGARVGASRAYRRSKARIDAIRLSKAQR